MRTEKEPGAMRVMEALSAVDEELLERSEKKPRRFVQRYGAACAACLCLLAVGAAYFSMSRMKMGGYSQSAGEMSGGGMEDNAAPMAVYAGDGGAPEEMADGAPEAAGNPFFDEETAALGEPEWMDVDRLVALTDELIQEKAEALIDQERQMEAAEEAGTSSGTAVQNAPEKEMQEVSVNVPEGYRPVETKLADLAGETQGSMVYEWSDGEHGLWLRVTDTELTADMRIDAEPPVYTVQEAWRELIPDAGADGYVQFGLLYENGMLVEYRGVLEREELIRLLETLTWQSF
ncbi:MAG: hypothetical protein NC517_00165 [Firmicutes bacterium]|nr:hypothetical protein [Bacillota bacterium]